MIPEAALPSDLLQMLAGSPDMGMSDQGFDDYGMGYGDNVVPLFPQEDPEHVVKLREIVMQLQHRAGMPNAVESFEPEKLSGLGQLCVREYDLDESSRDEWRQSADRAMNLAKQVKESKSEPWPNASNVKFPMLTTAALQFAARAYPAIVDGPRVVKGRIIGADPQGIKSGKADRVSQHMSYQLMFEVPNWETDLDTALHQLPIIGCCFKKIYAEPGTEAGFCDDLVSAFDITVNQKAKSLDTVPRITHKLELYPHEIIERQRDGRFVEFEFKGSGTDNSDDLSPHEFIEQHRYWDSDDDGFPEPWIITVHKNTQKVCKITAGFDPEKVQFDTERGRITKIPREKYFIKIPFIPDPQGGFYDIGFGKLLEPLADVIDTSINQMMDGGTLQNMGGGFIAAGVDVAKGKGEVRMRPGQYRTVQTATPDLRAGIVHMEHPGPSKVMFELLSLMIDAGKDIASIQDILVGDSPRNETATTTMARIEQGLKVFTAIYKRIYRALDDEFRMVFEINKRTFQEPKYVALLDEPVQVVRDDYFGEFDIIPTADPNTITDMQRMAKAQFALEEAKTGNPHINLFEATKRAFEAARMDAVEAILVPPKQEPSPQEKLAEEGAQAEVDLKRAQAVKTVVDAEVARAQTMQPLAAPMIAPLPVFAPQQGPQGPMPPMGPMPGMGDIPPEAMGQMMGAAEQGMPMEIDPQGTGMPPDQLAQMLEQAGNQMPPDAGMMPPA